MSRKALFQKKPHRLELPGGAVYVRSFTVGELLHVEDLRKEDADTEVLGYTVRRCCTDEAGEPLLKDDEPLDEIPLDTVRLVVEAVNRLSTGGKLETLTKNSDATG